MTSFCLGTFDDAERLVTYCRKYDEEIDITHGKYLISGKSVLGVMSLVGNIVGISIATNDHELKHQFINGIKELERK